MQSILRHLVLLVVTVSLWFVAAGGAARAENGFYELPMPIRLDTQFKRGDDAIISLAEMVGKPVILHFWATWCGPCVPEMKELDQFAEFYGEAVHVIAVSQDFRGLQAVEPFFERFNINHLKAYADIKGRMGRQFSVSALPQTFFINEHGLVVGGVTGPLDWQDENVKKSLEKHLSIGKKPA